MTELKGKMNSSAYFGKRENNVSNLWRWKLLRNVSIQQGGQQCVSQDLAEVLSHDGLLCHTTVILKGQDDWEV